MRVIWKYGIGLGCLLLTGCALLGPSPSAEQNNAAQRVVEAYDIPTMLAQAGPIVADSLSENLPAAVDQQARERLRAAVNESFAGSVLAEDVRSRLLERAVQEGKQDFLIKAAETLESDVAQKMIALEDAAATEEFAKGFSEFLDQPVEEGADARIEQLRSLAANLRIVELQIGFNLGMLRGMIEARNAAAPENYRTSPESQQRMLDNTREGLRDRLDRQVPLMLLYAYRDAGDDAVVAYERLQAQPALRWVNQALAHAVGNALNAAADRVPEHYRELAGEA